MNSLIQHYKNKRVFITGHTGFKGSWLLHILNISGAIIKGYALSPSTETSLYNLINGDELCESIINDIRYKDDLKAAILDFQPDYIFHLAAQPLVRSSYLLPTDTFEVNVMGTAYLLDAIRFLEKKCATVLITTDKVYQNFEWERPYVESDRLGGYDPYSSSKACSELIIDSYIKSFFNPNDYSVHNKTLASARAGNVIGGGDWAENRLIPDIVKSLHNHLDIIIRSPASIRPWQHVIEPLYGYLKLGIVLYNNPLKFAHAYNFGPYPSDSLSVEELVKRSISIWGKGKYITEQNELDPHEAGILKLDISKAINELNWKPKFNSQKAIERTINWYKSFYQGEDAISLMNADISYYENSINE